MHQMSRMWLAVGQLSQVHMQQRSSLGFEGPPHVTLLSLAFRTES